MCLPLLRSRTLLLPILPHVLHCQSGRCSFVSSLVILLNSCSWADFHFKMQREATKEGMVVSKSPLPAHVVKGIQDVLARFSSACTGLPRLWFMSLRLPRLL